MRNAFFLLFFALSARAQTITKLSDSFDETKIAYTDEGEGDTVLLIHGFINTKASWDKTALKKDLLDEGFRVVAIDLLDNRDLNAPRLASIY